MVDNNDKNFNLNSRHPNDSVFFSQLKTYEVN